MASYDSNYLDTDPEYRGAWWSTWDGEEPYIYLPHQCSEWKIGGIEDAKALVANLQALIEQGPPEPV